MSIVLYGGGIIDKRGSVAGSTFSRSKFGATVRAKTSPTNPKTNFNTSSRALLQSISGQWGTVLTEIERQQWNAFALVNPQTNVFGQTSYLSGQQWFVKLSINVVLNAGVISTTPPASGSYPAPLTFAISADSAAGGTITLTLTYPVYAGIPAVYVMVSPCVSPGTFYVNNKLRLTYSAGAAISPINITGNWKTRFKGQVILQGKKLFALCKVIDQNTGVSSTGILSSCIIT